MNIIDYYYFIAVDFIRGSSINSSIGSLVARRSKWYGDDGSLVEIKTNEKMVRRYRAVPTSVQYRRQRFDNGK